MANQWTTPEGMRRAREIAAQLGQELQADAEAISAILDSEPVPAPLAALRAYNAAHEPITAIDAEPARARETRGALDMPLDPDRAARFVAVTAPDGMVHIRYDGSTICGLTAASWTDAPTVLMTAGLVLLCPECYPD